MNDAELAVFQNFFERNAGASLETEVRTSNVSANHESRINLRRLFKDCSVIQSFPLGWKVVFTTYIIVFSLGVVVTTEKCS
jgi:hypothetical protein